MPFRATVLTLYPEMFPGHLQYSLSGKALERGQWSIETVQIRDFAGDRHRTVDDTPAGGGAGMVLKPDILAAAIDHAAPEGDPRPKLLMSPRGRPLTQARVRDLAASEGCVIVCGRFEGRDIPAVLTSGNHGAIEKWRRERAEELTRERRPDLWAAYLRDRT